MQVTVTGKEGRFLPDPRRVIARQTTRPLTLLLV